MDEEQAKCGIAMGRPRRTLEERAYSALGNEWCGNITPPMDHRSFYRGERVLSFVNDGWDIGVGTADEWIYIFRRDEFRWMVFTYLKAWALKDWFGLRSWLWFKLLTRKCARFK